jgi:putative transcriptional regulator
VKADGSRVRIHAKPLAPATVEYDPDCLPLTDERLSRMKRVPRVKSLRRALGLTQEEFAARYGVPLGTLRDWEQGRTEPDQPARAYLRVIAADPKGVARALQTSGG